MTNQGVMRTEPPVCHGNGGNSDGNEHCCYVAGEVCEFLVENDPRAPERRYACGILLNLKDAFPNFDTRRIWDRVQRHPLYEHIKAKFEASGTMLCGDYLGTILPDGTIEGQCCFAGYVFDSDGNVIKAPNG